MANDKPKRSTILDVARQSGVSYQTVSRVINNHPNVAPETRERVLLAIEKLKYRPNKIARSLAAHQSRTLAVITNSMKHYGPTQIVVNIEQNAQQAGYDVIFTNINPEKQQDVDTAIERLEQWSVDGVLLIAPIKHNQYDGLIHRFTHLPMVQIDIAPGANVPSVIIDQELGSRLATQHLIDLGHRRICEISGPLTWYGAVSRQVGYNKTLEEAGLDSVATLEGDWTAASGYHAAQYLLENASFSALVVANDQMALGATRAIQEHGLRVPDDVSLVGFDDTPESAFYSPPLTTVRQDFPTLGQMGLRYLFEQIQTPDVHAGQRVIEPHLIIRASTAPYSDNAASS